MKSCVRFLDSENEEMIVEKCDFYKFGFDHHGEVFFEHYLDFKHDAMVLDSFFFECTWFDSMGLMKHNDWKRSGNL